MNIRIGKTDVASLGCEGCKKKFVYNIANNSSADKTEVERVLGITVPEMDPPAIIDNSGGEGEKGVLLYLLNQLNYFCQNCFNSVLTSFVFVTRFALLQCSGNSI